MNIADTVWLIITVHILSCISPGPDFAVVVKNAMAYSRKSAILTACGIGAGILMHTTYCALGLALILMKFPMFFVVIRVIGAAYLIYLGAKAFFSKSGFIKTDYKHHKNEITSWSAFRQGFFVNALNPKAIFFIFTLFIMIAKLRNIFWDVFFIVEMTVVTALWFAFVAYCISHPAIKNRLMSLQKPIAKCLGIFLVVIGLQLLVGA